MLTALLSFLASKGLTITESGQLTAMATLPWTFKLFWGPVIDSFIYEKMGKRSEFGFDQTVLFLRIEYSVFEKTGNIKAVRL